MIEKSIWITGDSPALLQAAALLKEQGVPFAEKPEEASVLLYPIPTPSLIRADIPKGRRIIGGNLDFLDESFSKLDLLKDPYYVTQNAALTAQAALGLLLAKLECDFASAATLILGWGRIGKCLAKLLRDIGMPVSVYARKETDQAMLTALGYRAADLGDLKQYKCIINTAPAQLIYDGEAFCHDCIKIDLASVLSLPGRDVIHARGLPGKYKPEASGKLIAQTILNHRREVFQS